VSFIIIFGTLSFLFRLSLVRREHLCVWVCVCVCVCVCLCVCVDHTNRYNTRCYFNVRSKDDIAKSALIYRTELKTKKYKRKLKRKKPDMLRSIGKQSGQSMESLPEITVVTISPPIGCEVLPSACLYVCLSVRSRTSKTTCINFT